MRKNSNISYGRPTREVGRNPERLWSDVGVKMWTARKTRRKKARALSYLIIAAVVILSFSAGAIFGVTISNIWPSGGDHWSAVELENVQRASINIVAVKSSDDSGVLLDLNVEVRQGTGEIYVNTAPLVEADFQYAQWIAVEVASDYLDIPLDDDGVGIKGVNVSFSVTSDEPVQLIGGPSAGAAMTVLTIAVLENRQVRDNVVITGEIKEDGSIGAVGGLIEKAGAAEAAGKDLFLVPLGQSRVTVYREVTRQVGPFTRTIYEPVVVDLNEYAENAGWGIQIQEVSTIQEAVNLMLD